MPKAKKAAPREASESSPPLPDEPLPIARTEQDTVDVPIASLGDESDEDNAGAGEDSADEATATGKPGMDKTGKGKAIVESDQGETAEEAKPHPWQAVWSEEKNGALNEPDLS